MSSLKNDLIPWMDLSLKSLIAKLKKKPFTFVKGLKYTDCAVDQARQILLDEVVTSLNEVS